MFIDAVYYCARLILVLIATSGTSVTKLVSQVRVNLHAEPYRLEMISTCTAGAYHL